MLNPFNAKPYLNPILASLVLLISITLCYWPALNGPFVFDDQVNILENPAVKLQDLSRDSLTKALLSNESGAFKRILPALSFGLNYYQAQGFEHTSAFKITNLVVHLLNSLLVFTLMRQLAFKLWPLATPSPATLCYFSLAIAALWALHPLQVSTVMYIVQRMTTMASFFMLLGLNAYVWARYRLETGKITALAWMLLALAMGTALGLSSKENAVLLVLYAAVLEFTLFAQKPADKRILIFYGVLLGIPLLVGIYLIANDQLNILAGYYSRPFTLEQRLWTEARVLWFYLQMFVWPDITNMGLYHDDVVISKGWSDPPATLWSVIGWGGMLVIALWSRLRLPVLSFAILWFLVGHSMESSIIPLEIIFEHRNYLPLLGFICLLGYSLVYLAKLAKPSFNFKLATSLLISCACLFSYLTWQRAHYWESEESLFRSLANNNPQSPISLYSYAELLLKKKNQPAEAYQYYLKAANLNKDSASLAMQASLSAALTSQPDPLLQPDKLFILLNKRRLTPWDISVLDDASRCVLGNVQRCIEHLDDVRLWLHAAIDNRYLSPELRRAFVRSVFDIEMQYGLHQEALKTVTQAQEQDDRVFQYYLLRANALQALGRYQESMTIINIAEQLAQQYNPQLLGDVYQLKQQVEIKMQHGGPSITVTPAVPATP